MINISTTTCCGVRDISRLSSTKPKEAVEEVAESVCGERDGAPFFLFTGVTKENYGQELARYIRKNELGRVIKTKSKRNKNSGNDLTAWIWEIDRKKLLKIYRKM